MRKTIAFARLLTLGMALTLWASCEKDLPLYSDTQAKLNFAYEDSKDSVTSYSFIYNNGGDRDTVWLEVNTMGFLSNDVRHYEIEQVLTGTNDAVAGRHYVSFDDPAYKALLRIEPGAVADSLPIIVLRDSSLAAQDVQLKVRIKDTPLFKRGYADRDFKVVTISDQIVKPNRWGPLMDYLFERYGPVKHRFMIAHSDFKWDDVYFKEIGVSSYYADPEVQSFLRYMGSKFARELRRVNAERIAQGLLPLAEANGTPVSFGSYN